MTPTQKELNDRSTYRIFSVFVALAGAFFLYVALTVPMIAATAPLLIGGALLFGAWKLWNAKR
jgi:uncharacterized membrane protein